MEFADIDYARDIFTDLVVAWMVKTSRPPNPSESRVLAEKAFAFAKTYGTAVRRATSSAGKSSTTKPAGLNNRDPKRVGPASISG